MKKAGAIILAIGAFLTFFIALNFSFTTDETVVDAGNIQINQRQNHKLPWTPYAGVAVMVLGSGIYLLGMKRALVR